MALPDITCYESDSEKSTSDEGSIIGQLLANENELFDSDSEIPSFYYRKCSIETEKHNQHNDSPSSSTTLSEDCKSSSTSPDRIPSLLANYKTPHSQRRNIQRQKKKQQEKFTSRNSFLSNGNEQRQIPEVIKKWPGCVEVWLNMLYKEEATLRSRNARNVASNICNMFLPRMRAILVDWIMEVCEVYQLRRSTYYFTVDYIDRFLVNRTYIEKAQLQLLGITCLFIASKLEEIYPPNLSEFAYVCDGACTEQEILTCERLVLHILGWEVNPMTPTTWLNLYMQIDSMPSNVPNQLRQGNFNLLESTAHCSPTNKEIYFPTYSSYKFVRASQIIDLFSVDPAYSRFSYSIIAAAAMHFIVGEVAARTASGLALDQIELCVAHMSFFYEVISKSHNPRLLSVQGNGGGGACSTGIPPTACMPTGDLCSPAAFMVNTIDDNQMASYRAIRASIPNLIRDENHTMQIHCIDLNYYEQAVILRLERLGFKIEKKYSKHEKESAVSAEPSDSSELDEDCSRDTVENEAEDEDPEQEDKDESNDDEEPTTNFSTVLLYQLERTGNISEEINVPKLDAKIDTAVHDLPTGNKEIKVSHNDYNFFDLESYEVQFVNFDAILSSLHRYCTDELLLSIWQESNDTSAE